MIKDDASINKTAPTVISTDSHNIIPDRVGESTEWQRELAAAIRQPAELLRRLKLPEALLTAAELASESFPLLVPESYLRRMEVGNPHDPLLLQVLPQHAETVSVEKFTTDPVDDSAARTSAGLLQKYAGRALLITLGQCAVHCRYCFRRHYPYENEPQSAQQWSATLQSIEAQPDIQEVILSGGDPLVLGDRRLGSLLDELEQIPQLRRIRVHTRLPIVLPNRVTSALLDRFAATHLQPLFVVHANHGAEIVGDCADALRRLTRAGIPTLNQAVLLRGINDSVEIQADLCQRLINVGVIPYYLHQLDRVAGAAHFETDPQVGREIVASLKSQLPGYAVPRFVQEIPGESSKTELI